MDNDQLSRIKTLFVDAFANLTDEQLYALTVDGYVSLRDVRVRA